MAIGNAGYPVRVEATAESRIGEVNFQNIPFGAVYSDHMLTAEYRNGEWSEARIRPYGPLMLPPSISAFHYGISVFEGMKAYRSPEGCPLLFRPRDNARRFQRSAERLAMAPVPEELFLTGLRELVRLDQAWIPPSELGALYIRPVLFSIDPSIRVKPAADLQFIIFTSPFGSYFSAPAAIVVSETYARAFPGGTGDTKAAGNYAAALQADLQARAAGFDAVLWLDAVERRYIEECGVMNIFFVFEGEIVTPPLTGTTLPGVTRDSVITLLREMGHRVREDRIAMDEVVERHERGELRECFGTGTAAIVSHVSRIGYRGRTLELPPVEARVTATAVREKLVALLTGVAPDTHGWVETLR